MYVAVLCCSFSGPTEGQLHGCGMRKQRGKQRQHSISTQDPALTVASMKANGVRVLRATREAGRASPRSLCSHTRVTSNDVQPTGKGLLGKDGGLGRDWEARG